MLRMKESFYFHFQLRAGGRMWSEREFEVGQICQTGTQRRHGLGHRADRDSPSSRGWDPVVGLLLPELLRLVEDLGALHPEQQEHRDDGQQGCHRVRDDELEYEDILSGQQ